MKLTKMRYSTVKGEIKLNSYLINIPKKYVIESGIDDTKELKIEAKEKKIIIMEK